jgi:hypothetical protein
VLPSDGDLVNYYTDNEKFKIFHLHTYPLKMQGQLQNSKQAFFSRWPSGELTASVNLFGL